MEKGVFDKQHIIDLTTTLNEWILAGDFEKYKEVVSKDITCF